MRAFVCPTCQNLVYFDSTFCVRCSTELAFDPGHIRMVALDQDGTANGIPRCINIREGCNWLTAGSPVNTGVCKACALTRSRPSDAVLDADAQMRAHYVETVSAKRWLVYQLEQLRLPIIDFHAQPDGGLAFDLAQSTDDHQVMIGHLNGTITIDMSEANDAHREALRAQLDEPYRTMLGHFRHEIGHYYWQLLVDGTAYIDHFRELFGDERQDYGAALDAHYGDESTDDWHEQFISQYATTHPWEDFAETFAHYLHITDTLETCAAFELRTHRLQGAWSDDVANMFDSNPGGFSAMSTTTDELIAMWLPLALALNQVNRSMGKDDLYPFTLAPKVTEKLRFVVRLVRSAAIRDAALD